MMRSRFSRHALGLWFLGVAAIGLLRFWMEHREAGAAPLAADAWLWLAGGATCGLAGTVALLRSLHDRREDS